MSERWCAVWNAVMYKRPANEDEGIEYPLRPRFVLRLWRRWAEKEPKT